MSQDMNPIDDLFRKSLRDQEQEPPRGVWDEVRAEISTDKIFREKLFSHEKPVPPGVWLRVRKNISVFRPLPFWQKPVLQYAAASVIVLIAGFWYLNQEGAYSGIQYAQTPLLSLQLESLLPQKNSVSESVSDQTPGKMSAPSNLINSGLLNNLYTASQNTNSDLIRGTETQPVLFNIPESAPVHISEALPVVGDSEIKPVQKSLIPEMKDIRQDHKLLAQNPKKSIEYSGEEAGPARSMQADGWMVSSVFSPDLNFGSNRSLGSALGSAQSGLQYTAGVRVGYAVNERWTIQSGVQYADRGTQMIPRGEQDNYASTSSFSRMGAPVIVKSQIIDIPVVLRYRILGDKLRWYLNSGFSANLSGGASSVLFGSGAELRAGKQFSVSMEPTVRRMVEKMPNVQPNSIGLLTGVNYKF